MVQCVCLSVCPRCGILILMWTVCPSVTVCCRLPFELVLMCSLPHGIESVFLAGPHRCYGLSVCPSYGVLILMWTICLSVCHRLPFETVLMCSLPRESRLCFTLVGVRIVQSTTTSSSEASQRINVPLGWVTTQLYNQQLYVAAAAVVVVVVVVVVASTCHWAGSQRSSTTNSCM